MTEDKEKDTSCPPPVEEFSGSPENATERLLYALDKKLTVVCNKIDNMHESQNEIKLDVRELREENRKQSEVAAEHVSWKHFLIILIALVGFVGGAYAYTHHVDDRIDILHSNKKHVVVSPYQP